MKLKLAHEYRSGIAIQLLWKPKKDGVSAKGFTYWEEVVAERKSIAKQLRKWAGKERFKDCKCSGCVTTRSMLSLADELEDRWFI